ncbi:MAG: ribonuclease P protein component [Nitrospinae bacterium CG11_big_fil_rev_8_21_14_0_20_56_8]|nr:MAG: ribonuclease P protein component [Nitrospinae bacterium CG11_big_fil_rev_8_21_14_0_20_56_8]
MGEFSFRKNERLAKREQFDKVLSRGKRKRVENLFTLYLLPNGHQQGRLGIIASRKVGSAVKRNLVKRRIREVFRKIKHRIRPAMDIVVITGRELVPLPYSVLEQKISKSLLENQ